MHGLYYPTTRVLAVLRLLQTRGRVSGAELAERLDVDRRTVRRYVTMLQDLGVPLETVRGRHGGYVLRRGFTLPPLMFSEDEALAAVLGLLAARRLGLAATTLAVDGALAKIERLLPEHLHGQVQAVGEVISLDLPASDVPAAGGPVVTLSAASQQRRRVWLRYRSRSADAETERFVDPYGVVYHAGRWYAVGYCHLREDLRVFRLDRVLEADLGDDTFTPPTDFDSLAYVLEAIARAPGTWEVDLLLETTISEARGFISPTLGVLTPAAGGVQVHCHIEDLGWFARFLASFPCHLMVRHPSELRDLLRQVAVEVAANATRGES